MVYKMYSIRDNKSGFFAPRIETNEACAIRNFAMALNSGDNLMNFAPSDFSLHEVGSFDDEKGVISALDIPVFIISGESVYGVGVNYEK